MLSDYKFIEQCLAFTSCVNWIFVSSLGEQWLCHLMVASNLCGSVVQSVLLAVIMYVGANLDTWLVQLPWLWIGVKGLDANVKNVMDLLGFDYLKGCAGLLTEQLLFMCASTVIKLNEDMIRIRVSRASRTFTLHNVKWYVQAHRVARTIILP